MGYYVPHIALSRFCSGASNLLERILGATTNGASPGRRRHYRHWDCHLLDKIVFYSVQCCMSRMHRHMRSRVPNSKHVSASNEFVILSCSRAHHRAHVLLYETLFRSQKRCDV